MIIRFHQNDHSYGQRFHFIFAKTEVTFMRKYCALFLLTFLNLCSSSSSQENGLFRYIDKNAARLNSRQTEIFARIQKRPTTIQIHMVRIDNLLQLQNRQSLILNLPGRSNIDARVSDVFSREQNRFTWRGSGRDAEELVVLNVNKQNVNGVIHLKDGFFLLEPLGGGIQILTLVDQTKFPPDDPSQASLRRKASSSPNGSIAGPSLKLNQIKSTLVNPVIDILVVYTAAAASSVADIGNLIDNAISVTNTIHSNSDVSASVAAVHTAQVSYTETGNLETDTERLQGTSDGYMDNVHTLRDQYGADVVVLLVDEGDYAGWAYAIEASSSGAFATVRTEEAVSNYTFAHEVGHLVGGRHDDDPATTPRAYAHGYAKKTGSTFKTVMAVWEGASRIPNWSNPNVNYNGSPTGTSDYNNVARVWNERASTVAGFKTPPAPTAPYNLVITNANNNGQAPHLSWEHAQDSWFDHYNIYRCSDQGQCQFTVIGTTTSKSYTDYDVIINTSSSITFYYYVTTVNSNSLESSGSNTVSTKGDPPQKIADPAENSKQMQKDFFLAQNHPNPFNPETEISFALPEPSTVRLTVLDVLGREVAILEDRYLPAGYRTVQWNGKTEKCETVTSGVYFYRITAVGESGKIFTQTMKMLLAK
jgi:hypothetical protein